MCDWMNNAYAWSCCYLTGMLLSVWGMFFNASASRDSTVFCRPFIIVFYYCCCCCCKSLFWIPMVILCSTSYSIIVYLAIVMVSQWLEGCLPASTCSRLSIRSLYGIRMSDELFLFNPSPHRQFIFSLLFADLLLHPISLQCAETNLKISLHYYSAVV